MRLTILTTTLFLIIMSGYAQDYMDKIVAECCECLEEVPDSLNKQEASMKMGICMLNASQPYAKQLKKDYGIDLNKMDRGEGEKLGRMVGVRLATACPSSLMKIVNRVKPELLEEAAADEATLNSEGTVTAIESNTFVSFSVKDEDGKTSKYYWTTFIDNDIDLATDYEAIKGKKVYIEYTEEEMYDPRLKEYRKVRIVTAIALLD